MEIMQISIFLSKRELFNHIINILINNNNVKQKISSFIGLEAMNTNIPNELVYQLKPTLLYA